MTYVENKNIYDEYASKNQEKEEKSEKKSSEKSE